MKLVKVTDCLGKLNGLFDRNTQDFKTAYALCDVMCELEKQSDKFIKVRQLILNEHYDLQDGGEWILKKGQDLDEIQKKFNDLNELEFAYKKVKIKAPDGASAREIYYLKEFFDFEQTED